MTANTIFALASAPGTAGVAVVRVSGQNAHIGLRSLCGEQKIPMRRAILRKLIHPVSRETLDDALILAFSGPHSYTGEDVVEYHLHGGKAVVDGVLSVLSEQPDYRLAEPGEFTRRAFQNGKMDLTEAEAVADLVHAETQLQRTQALMQMGGALMDLYEPWRTSLTRILAYVEAELEFPDEDLPDDILSKIMPEMREIIGDIDSHLNDNRRGERLRDGIHVAIIGAPNAGKSSLVNLLARRDVAIVSDVAGTTRDVIEVHLDIAGYPVILSDTAGLRPDQVSEGSQDAIEQEGIRRAFKVAERADIRVIVHDGTKDVLDPHSFALEEEGNAIVLLNKVDQAVCLKHPKNPLHISVVDEAGIEEFLVELQKKIEVLFGVSETPTLTRQRHRDALIDCVAALNRCLDAPLPELVAEDLRLAIRHIGRITGKVDVEDLLDVVFRDFCIGK